MYYAHKRNIDNDIELQSVYDHLYGTANRAAECLQRCGLEKTAYLMGLLHDMGKYTRAFQEYLEEGDSAKRGSVIHTFQGTHYTLERFHHGEFQNIAASELIAWAIASHHGVIDCVNEKRELGLLYRERKQDIGYDESVQAFLSECLSEKEIDEIFQKATKELETLFYRFDKQYEDDSEYYFEFGLLARLLLSALIEGDRHDTVSFMSGKEESVWPVDMRPIWTERLNYLEKKLLEFSSDTSVQKARAYISQQCRDFSQKPKGIYRLNVPTGGGKTLGGLRFALAHAACHNHRRLIFTSPLLSILEQNAKVVHDYVGDDSLILEHHSNVVQTSCDQETLDRRELLVQNWDAPIIITTLVQLLNTLFDGKTTSIRRFQALCDSIIVIDEVQTVPPKMLTLFNLAIRFLAEQCGATIVLCSATQPAFEKANHPLPMIPEDIVPYNAELWQAFRRTEILALPDIRESSLPNQVFQLMEESRSLLVVCNTKREAAKLLSSTISSDWHSFHLSASMCMQHRRDVLKQLKKALEQGEKVLCISTQVIEAGVDISFERVMRLAAGMDSVVQSAGRCNRNGEFNGPCPVYIVNCTDENLGKLRDIQIGKTASMNLLNSFQKNPVRFQNSLSSEAAIKQYYTLLYQEMEDGYQEYTISRGISLFDLLSVNTTYADENCEEIDRYCLRQAFKAAGQAFSVFEENSTDVIVPYGEGKQLIAKLCGENCRYNIAERIAVLKECSSYTVSLYTNQLKKLEEQGALVSVCDGAAIALKEWYYDQTVGVVTERLNLPLMEV